VPTSDPSPVGGPPDDGRRPPWAPAVMTQQEAPRPILAWLTEGIGPQEPLEQVTPIESYVGAEA